MNSEKLLNEVKKILEKEPRLIQLPPEGKVIFVGDTHGDLDATRKLVERYLKKPYRIVFLGDYVDRGTQSEENIRYLIELKYRHPGEIFLLMGNHEGYMIKEFYPANFWESLLREEKETYGQLFSNLPLCATSKNGILALHGALPDLESIEEINRIKLGDLNWDRIVWGDFVEEKADIIGDFYGRPQFGQIYFERIMDKFQKNILIRSHQPNAPVMMFNKRCITIFTSHAYIPIRTIVVVDMEKEVKSGEDIIIERI
jgi:predicted phosphodiesterase